MTSNFGPFILPSALLVPPHDSKLSRPHSSLSTRNLLTEPSETISGISNVGSILALVTCLRGGGRVACLGTAMIGISYNVGIGWHAGLRVGTPVPSRVGYYMTTTDY